MHMATHMKGMNDRHERNNKIIIINHFPLLTLAHSSFYMFTGLLCRSFNFVFLFRCTKQPQGINFQSTWVKSHVCHHIYTQQAEKKS